MTLTTDPNHPGLTRGVDKEPAEQAPVYLVLSDEERAKGFTRPYRDAYCHVGVRPKYPLRELTDEEKARHVDSEYHRYEEYPKSESMIVGRYWTKAELNNRGCGSITTMPRAISETYARDPRFYGSTYCCSCAKHLPVREFTWYEMDGTEGPVVGS